MTNNQIWQQVEEKFDCEHELMEVRYRVNGSKYVNQCQTCGWTGPAISHSNLTASEKQNARAVDDAIRDDWYAARRDYSASLQEMQKRDQKQDWFIQHNAYLRSPEWKARRGKVLRRDGYICQACLSNPATQVHHLTYKHWGHEPLFELEAICEPCHDDITAMDRGEKAARPDTPDSGNGYALDEVPY